jgi:uncharacterized delta-60 repeat protein
MATRSNHKVRQQRRRRQQLRINLERLEGRSLLSIGLPAGFADFAFNGFGFTTTQVAKVDEVRASALQPDGKIVVAGSVTELSGSQTIALVRYLPNGQLDAGFGGPADPGVAEVPSGSMIDDVYAVAVDHNPGSPFLGDIVVAGSRTASGGQHQLALARFQADGSLDANFGTSGIANDPRQTNATGLSLAIRPDDGIVVLGVSNWTLSSAQTFVESFKPDGTLDPNFGTPGQPVARPFGAVPTKLGGKLVLDAGGNIVVAAVEPSGASSAKIAVARLTSNGQADRSFGPGGIATTTVTGNPVPFDVGGLVIDRSGRVLVSGTALVYTSSVSSGTPMSSDFWVARFNTTGSLDPSFNRGSVEFINFPQNGQEELSSNAGIGLAPDGKIVLGGDTLGETGNEDSPNREYDIAVARLNPDGTPDRSFGEVGRDVSPLGFGNTVGANVHAVLVQPDGDIVTAFTYQIAGSFEVSSFGAARFAGHEESLPANSGTIPAGLYGETFVTAANSSTPTLDSSNVFAHFLSHNFAYSGDRIDVASGHGWDIVRQPAPGSFELLLRRSGESPAAQDAITFGNLRPDVRVALASVDVAAIETAYVTFVGTNGSYTVMIPAHTTRTASAGESHVLTGTLLAPALELGPIQEVVLDSQNGYFYNLKVLVIPGQGPLDDFVTAAPGTSTPIDVLDYATGAAPTVGLEAPLVLVAPLGQPNLPGGQTTISSSDPSDIVYDNTLSAQPGQHPIDSFTYTVKDANGLTATGTVYVTIDTPPVVHVIVNHADGLTSDGWDFPHGTPGPLTGVVNISDADDDPVSLAVYAQASPGVVSLTKTSDTQYTFSYTPPTTYGYDPETGVSSTVSAIVGRDHFTLRASDLGSGGQPLSTVDQPVSFVVEDHAPETAQFLSQNSGLASGGPTHFVVPANVGLSYYKPNSAFGIYARQHHYYDGSLDYPGLVHFAAPGVLWNQDDYEGLIAPGGVLPVFDPLRAELVTPPQHGRLYLFPDGSFNYTPNPGFVGTDHFQFDASDGYLVSKHPNDVDIHVVAGTPGHPFANAPVLHDIQYFLAGQTSSGFQFTPPIYAYANVDTRDSNRRTRYPSDKVLIRPVYLYEGHDIHDIGDFGDPVFPKYLNLNLFDVRHQPDFAYQHDLSLSFDATDRVPRIYVGRTVSSVNIEDDNPLFTEVGGEFGSGTATVSMTVATVNSIGWLSNFAAVRVEIAPPHFAHAMRAIHARRAWAHQVLAGASAMARVRWIAWPHSRTLARKEGAAS